MLFRLQAWYMGFFPFSALNNQLKSFQLAFYSKSPNTLLTNNTSYTVLQYTVHTTVTSYYNCLMYLIQGYAVWFYSYPYTNTCITNINNK